MDELKLSHCSPHLLAQPETGVFGTGRILRHIGRSLDTSIVCMYVGFGDARICEDVSYYSANQITCSVEAVFQIQQIGVLSLDVLIRKRDNVVKTGIHIVVVLRSEPLHRPF